MVTLLILIAVTVWLRRRTQGHYSLKQPLYMRKTYLPTPMAMSSGWLDSEEVGGMFGRWAGNTTHSAINPATGLPTVSGDSFGIDVGGNSYGFNNHDFGSNFDHHDFSSSFDSHDFGGGMNFND